MPPPVIVKNLSQKTIVCEKARIADTFFARAKGLLGQESLAQGHGLVITRCHSIHMFFMRFAIDAIFIDVNGVVVGLVEGIRPGDLSPVFWRACKVVETPVGTIKKSQTKLGDSIEIVRNTL